MGRADLEIAIAALAFGIAIVLIAVWIVVSARPPGA